MDQAAERYAQDVASAMAAVLGSRLVGTYLHGSAVLGGFDARRSDVDILVVCDGAVPAAQRTSTAAALGEQRLPCPARGLELSMVTAQAARQVTAAPAFELHMTTAPEDAKVIDGHGRGGDADLVLHFAVCRSAGRLLGPGRPAAGVFGPVPDGLVRTQLAAELRWGAGHAAGEYAVLNACRAWRFAADGVLVSKVAGGRWAMRRVRGPDRELIRVALDRQRCLPAAGLDRHAVRAFVGRLLSKVSAPASG
jgi:streptomycin 3"-adenylyltransferase